MNAEPTVFIVDDDPAALDSLRCLLQSVDLQPEAYSSPTEFLQAYDPERPGCLVLDVRMPEMSGLDVQQELLRRGGVLPIIIVTGHADVLMCTTAFKAGAFDFLEKPANDQVLLSRIQKAIERDRRHRRARNGSPTVLAQLQRLTQRERQVMALLVSGFTLKRVAGELGISIQTAAKHRTKVLDKLQVTTDVELVRLVLPLEEAEPR